MAGLSGHGEVVLYASTNLATWDPILTNPPTIGALQLLDAAAAGRPARWYRAEER